MTPEPLKTRLQVLHEYSDNMSNDQLRQHLKKRERTRHWLIWHDHSSIATILDKTVEKIAYLGGIFCKLRSRPILPSPPPPGSSVVGSSKESRIPKHLYEATLNWGRGFSLRKAVYLEIVLLR